MNTQRLLDNKQLKLAIALKTSQLQREQLSSLTYQHVEATMLGLRWKRKKPVSMNEAVNDIFSLTASEIVAYLSSQAVIAGSKMKITDFNDLLGGN